MAKTKQNLVNVQMTQEQLETIKGWMNASQLRMAEQLALSVKNQSPESEKFYKDRMVVVEDLERRLNKADARTYDTSEDADDDTQQGSDEEEQA